MPKRTRQYARTTGSSSARMILRTCSLRIDAVSGALAVEAVGGRHPGAGRREALDPLVPARRPPLLEDHDELRWRGLQVPQEFGAEPPDERPGHVVEEVEVVDEA